MQNFVISVVVIISVIVIIIDNAVLRCADKG
jgi:hypothetical protein